MLPNILYLHSHDTGRSISPYGHAVATPNLQRFAEQGVVFRQAFSCAPTCSPSRASLLCSQWPHQTGMLGLAHRGFSLNDCRQTWLHTFHDAGYFNVLAGLEHLGLRAAMGLDHRPAIDLDLAPASSQSPDVIPNACQWLVDRRSEQPFFMDIGLFETHRTEKQGDRHQWHNGEASPVGDPRYLRPPAVLPDNPGTRLDFADFCQSVERLDDAWGQVLDTLDQTGLADNTIVIITTDHGIAFPGMKCTLTDHGTGVLLMMRGPDRLQRAAGKVVDSMVSHMDVLPTLCNLVNLPIPEWCHGRSMAGLLDGTLDAQQPDSLHRTLFAEVNYHAAYEPMRSARTSGFKLIRRFHRHPFPIQANCDDSVSKSQWLEEGAGDREVPRIQLFDLLTDPMERCDLADHPDYLEHRVKMENKLLRWMEQTKDPLLYGPVRPPKHAKINLPEHPSPTVKPVDAKDFDPAAM